MHSKAKQAVPLLLVLLFLIKVHESTWTIALLHTKLVHLLQIILPLQWSWTLDMQSFGSQTCSTFSTKPILACSSHSEVAGHIEQCTKAHQTTCEMEASEKVSLWPKTECNDTLVIQYVMSACLPLPVSAAQTSSDT